MTTFGEFRRGRGRRWRAVHSAALSLLALVCAGSVALAQVTVYGGLQAAKDSDLAVAQRQFVGALESFAAANASPGTLAYWAIIETNLGHIARLQEPGGENARADANWFSIPPEVLQWSDARKSALPPKGALLQHRLDEFKHGQTRETGPRIFGGRRVDAGTFPEVVALATPWCSSDTCPPEGTPQSFEAFCSGTLIAADAVLTAGHCLCKETYDNSVPLAANEFVVVFGDDVRAARRGMLAYRVSHADHKAADAPRNVDADDRVKLCEDYNWRGRDLALVRLGARIDSSSMPGSPPKQPAELPASAAIAAPQMMFGLRFGPQLAGELSALQPGQSAPIQGVLVGFGYSEQILSPKAGVWITGIKYFTRTLIDELVCPAGHVSGCAPGRELTAIGDMPKATKKKARSDTCTGDSGGPFFVADGRDRRYLIGATSRAAGIAHMLVGFENSKDCGTGGIYSLLNANALEWLTNNGVKYRLCIAAGVCFEQPVPGVSRAP